MSDPIVRPTLETSVPLIQGDQVWEQGVDGSGTMIAVLDTGVDSAHPFLAGKVVEEACYSTSQPGLSQSLCPSGANEQIGAGAATPCTLTGCEHGTHVAGIAAGGSSDPSHPFPGVAKGAELKKTFEEGVVASRAGNLDEAIAKFTHGAELSPTCADCYYNIGFAYSQKKEYDKAEAAYKKAIEIKADYGEAYNGLANIYNAQRKFDEAAAASTKAAELGGGGAAGAGGGNVNAMYNQGVILWNAGKIPEAKKQFEAVITADPNHAESHYQLGMALVNEGNLAAAGAEFEKYVQIAPNGPNAATAKSLVAQLKK